MIPVSSMMDGAGISDAVPGTHAPLLPETDPRRVPDGGRRERSSSTVIPVIVSAVLLLGLAAVTIFASQNVDGQGAVMPAGDVADGRVVDVAASRGVVEGVSEKSNAPLLDVAGAVLDYGWTNAMLSWQRTAFHFQPAKNWMNG
jgi:hypothetical protein